MADGSGVLVHGRIVGGREAEQRTLRQALATGHVVSRCADRCGHYESVRTTPWLHAGEGDYSLGVLARRLRCCCGAREVRLEIWPLAPVGVEGRIYHWR